MSERAKLMKRATLTFIAFLMFIGIVYAAVNVGQIVFPYEIVEKKAALTSDVTIDLGVLEFGESVTQPSVDSASDLIVYADVDIDLTLSGHTDFTAFSCTVELKKAGSVIYSATVSKAMPTATITGVSADTYDVFVAYTCTAGSSASTGSVTISLSYS